jgi:hypothetical protein
MSFKIIGGDGVAKRNRVVSFQFFVALCFGYNARQYQKQQEENSHFVYFESRYKKGMVELASYPGS